ncbi:transporter, major facilitator family [marine gamma proteobacterium HTCC2148]|nr:transporter, major facilitator family [marine gamma proteobacterium HTCC2148]
MAASRSLAASTLIVSRNSTHSSSTASGLALSQQNFLLAAAFIMPLTFSVWQALLNNFVVERAAFTGAEIGMLQSLREVPGFLAFTAVFVLLVVREQRFALGSLLVMSVGVALTPFFPSTYGLYATTVVMSMGFHYFETINKSLTLQWIEKTQTPHFMGKAMAVKAAGALLAYSSIWLLMEWVGFGFTAMYLLAGGIGVVITLALWVAFPHFPEGAVQHKKLIFRRRYWLYYALTFLSGARRQIFMVFAGFMMVEKFGYSAADISLLYLANYVFNLFFAPRIGSWVGRVGERRALRVEYVGLIIVFSSYAFVENANVAAGLYIVDHLFFALSIAINTYFQKISDPKDIAATSSVSFTINHIAAVFIPALLGILWLTSPSAVFLVGSAIAVSSLVLCSFIPDAPDQGRETRFSR